MPLNPGATGTAPFNAQLGVPFLTQSLAYNSDRLGQRGSARETWLGDEARHAHDVAALIADGQGMTGSRRNHIVSVSDNLFNQAAHDESRSILWRWKVGDLTKRLGTHIVNDVAELGPNSCHSSTRWEHAAIVQADGVRGEIYIVHVSLLAFPVTAGPL